MASQPTFSEVRKIVFYLPLWQLLIGVILGLAFAFMVSTLAGISAFFGASISCAGSLVFAFVVFGLGEVSSQNMMKQMFRAEAFKILTIGIMFYCAFALLGLSFLPVIVGFMATLMVFFVALLTKFR